MGQLVIFMEDQSVRGCRTGWSEMFPLGGVEQEGDGSLVRCFPCVASTPATLRDGALGWRDHWLDPAWHCWCPGTWGGLIKGRRRQTGETFPPGQKHVGSLVFIPVELMY